MKYKIVSDSSSNIFTLSGVEYQSVPLKIISKEKEYVDEPGLDVSKMVSELSRLKKGAKTSCPNVFEWMDAFKGAENVFAVTITSGLSGSYSSALQAKEQYEKENPNVNILVIDSLSTGPEMELIIEKLQEYIALELSFEEIKEKITEYQRSTNLLVSLQSLDNLAKNGRVSAAVAKLAGVLGIRVIGEATKDGVLKSIHKSRGEKKALETIFEEMKSRGYKGGKVRMSHCDNIESAETLKNMILKKFKKANIKIRECTALCSFYAEKGGVIVGFEG